MDKKDELSLEDSGERMIPEYHKDKIIYAEHLSRYISVSNLIKGKVVLDIASGSGYGTKYMSSFAKKVYGIDIDPLTIEYAKEKYNSKNIDYLLGNASSIPLDSDTVDVVISMETIEHLKEQDAFIREIKRVLKTGGTFIVSTPNKVEYPNTNHFHIKEHDEDSLRRLLKKHFKYVNFFYQTDDVVSSILSKSKLNREIISEKWKIKKTNPLESHRSIYFIVSCSDLDSLEIMENTVFSEFYSYHNVVDAWNREHELWNWNQELQKKNKELEDQVKILSMSKLTKFKLVFKNKVIRK